VHSIHELRLVVAKYYFCEDRPAFLPNLGMGFVIFWDKLNARASRGMTKEEWEKWMRDGGGLGDRKCLTAEEFEAFLEEARLLEIEV